MRISLHVVLIENSHGLILLFAFQCPVYQTSTADINTAMCMHISTQFVFSWQGCPTYIFHEYRLLNQLQMLCPNTELSRSGNRKSSVIKYVTVRWNNVQHYRQLGLVILFFEQQKQRHDKYMYIGGVVIWFNHATDSLLDVTHITDRTKLKLKSHY